MSINFYIKGIITLFVMSPVLLLAQGRVLHAPPAGVEVGKDVEINVSVESQGESLSDVKLLYRERGTRSYKEISMIESSGLYSAIIPGSDVSDAGLEYLIIAELGSGGQIAFPEVDPYEQPIYLVTLLEKKSETIEAARAQGAAEGSNMVILSPEVNSRVRMEETLIAVSLFYTENLDLSTIKMFINGIDISDNAIISEELITYAPDDIDAGLKTVIIEASDQFGESLRPLQWEFNVVSDQVRTESRFKISGRGFVDTRSDKIKGQTEDVSTSRLSFRGNYDFLKFRGLAYVTSKEDKFLQPKNRYMFALSTNWLKVNFGDINPNISPLTISGKRIRGIEGNLLLGFFNLHTVYGELEREIPSDINLITEPFEDFGADGLPMTLDAGEGNKRYDKGEPFTDINDNGKHDSAGDIFRSGTFRRSLFAIRPSFGPNKSLQWGLTFARARDDSLIAMNIEDRADPSLLPGRPSRFDYTNADNEDIFIDIGKTPQDNMIIGSDLFLGFNNNRFILEGEVALSLLARDITDGPFTKVGLDTLLDENQGFGYRDDEPFTDADSNGIFDFTDINSNGKHDVGEPSEPFEDANNDGVRTLKDKPDGQISGFDIPFNPEDLESLFILNRSVIPLDPTGLNSLSYNAGFKFSYLKQFIRARYRFVGAEFNSLANPFIRKDIKGFDVSDRIRLLSNKMIVNVRYERLENNLAGDKENTTVTTSFDGGLSIYPGRDLPRISLNIRDYQRDNSIDTTGFNAFGLFVDKRELTSTITSTFSIGYDANAFGAKHNINLNISNSEKTDDFEEDRLNEEFIDLDGDGVFDPGEETFTDVNGDSAFSSFVSSNFTSTQISVVVNTQYDLPFKTQFQFLQNKNETSGQLPFTYTILSVGGEYLMFNEKLALNGALKRSSTTGSIEFNENRISVGARYNIGGNQSILANANFSTRTEKGTDGNSDKTFNDTIFRARYSLSF